MFSETRLCPKSSKRVTECQQLELLELSRCVVLFLDSEWCSDEHVVVRIENIKIALLHENRLVRFEKITLEASKITKITR